MLLDALVLVFISAILHVTWNVMLQSETDPLDIATKAISLGVLVLTPCAVLYWIFIKSPFIPPLAFLYGFLAGVAELGYFLFLSYSYRHGQLSVVYPIARGSAPIITVILGLFLLHEQMSTPQIIGIILLLAGIGLVRQTQIKGGKGVIPAFITCVFIAIYTVVDKIGLYYTSPILFGEIMYVFTALCLLMCIPMRRYFTTVKSKTSRNTPWGRILVVGTFIILAYQLVLFALNIAPVAIISPLRESASVVVTAWGIWKLKERAGIGFKIIGVCLIFTGIVLLAI